MTSDSNAAQVCKNCKLRPATGLWVGEGGVWAYIHGASVPWCEHCMVEAKLKYAREQASHIGDLERRLAELDLHGGEV